jgi:hypothetical protein
LYSGIIAELKANHLSKKLLTDLPLVSDQGKALGKLVRHFDLDWKLCHRHMIENAGASSLVGSWVSRILRCCSEAEYKHVRDVINLEVETLYRKYQPNRLYPKGYGRLKMLLDPECADWQYQLDHWARWRCIGCPNTSNAAESVHAKLNAQKRQRRLFMGRLQLVVNYCQKRYDERNVEGRRTRRASNDFLLMLKRPAGQDMLAAEDTGKLEFYTRLNTFRETWDSPLIPPENQKWLFPERSLDGILRSSDEDITITDADPVKHRLPNDWLPPQLQKPGKKWQSPDGKETVIPGRLKVFLGEPGDETDIDAQERKSGKLYCDLAWEIILSIRWMKPKEWEARRVEIICDTVALGERLRINEELDMTQPANEVKWRTMAYELAGISTPPGVEQLRLAAPPPLSLENPEPKRRGRPPRHPKLVAVIE